MKGKRVEKAGTNFSKLKRGLKFTTGSGCESKAARLRSAKMLYSG